MNGPATTSAVATRRHPLQLLWPYVRQRRWRYVVGFGIVVLRDATSLFFPLILGMVIDALVAGVGFRRLLVYAAVFAAVAVGRSVFSGLVSWIFPVVGREIEYDLRNDLFAHLERQSAGFYARWAIGDLMSRTTNDLISVRMLLGSIVAQLASALLTFLLAAAMMMYLDWRLALVVLAPTLVAAFASRGIQTFARPLYANVLSRLAVLTGHVREYASAVRVVRSFVEQEAEHSRFNRCSRELFDARRRFLLLQAVVMPCMTLLVSLASVAVLWIGGQAVLAQDLTVGELVAFVQLTAMVTMPLLSLSWIMLQVGAGTASCARLSEILALAPEITDALAVPAVGVPAEIRGEIELRELTFAYDSTPVLRDLSVHIPAGTTLAIVGPTGSGKSTLVKLIGRLYESPEGSLLLDGRPLTHHRLAALREASGFVLQESFLFNATIGDNIALGGGDAGSAEVVRAAEIAAIAEDIAQFPLGYRTMVGERGITLSGGQKQRIAIARAMVRNPRILVLDDALSSVDTETEARILTRLLESRRERTTIIIAHRASALRHADQIIVIVAGQIVERGSHEELLAYQGYYAEMLRKQSIQEELERT